MNLRNLVRRPNTDARDPQSAWTVEWLVTNGLGGYASGTACGACTRRYHGLLVAALPAPLGRYVMLDRLDVQVEGADGQTHQIDRQQIHPGDDPTNSKSDTGFTGDFYLEAGLPVWHYDLPGLRLEKRLFLLHLQNTACIVFKLLNADGAIKLRLRPELHVRPHDANLGSPFASPQVDASGQRWEIRSADGAPLRLSAAGPQAEAVLDGGRLRQNYYATEDARGYDHSGNVWSPGYFRFALQAGDDAALWASTERWDQFADLDPDDILQAEVQRRAHLVHRAVPAARRGMGVELILAADQFIIRPNSRPGDEAIAEAAGEEARTMIAGYHWFTDWGRDTMISLEGLTLTTGRHEDARQMLHTFSRYVRDGLLPNLFPEGAREAQYHTADATLLYFHALSRYWVATRDREMLEMVAPILKDIVAWHQRGTRFGIHVDPQDGLLVQGAPGYQLTWMDAKMGDWVVTPRRGKAVEINALWYNALRLLEGWYRELGDEAAAAPLMEEAGRLRKAFNIRFWNEAGGYLFDVVDGETGNDASFRPNQIFAISLEHPVLDAAHWKPVLDKVAERLLTPVGLRTLSADHADYRTKYDGDLRSRDGAYHQGTVWPWLIGPFMDAWRRVYPDRLAEAAQRIAAFDIHLSDRCLGNISEIFDAEPPYHARGCIAQAWSVAEVLRCWAGLTE